MFRIGAHCGLIHALYFESMNGHLKKLFHGTRLTKQVCIQLIGSNHRGGFNKFMMGRDTKISLPPFSLLIFPFGGGGGIYGLDEACAQHYAGKIATLGVSVRNKLSLSF